MSIRLAFIFPPHSIVQKSRDYFIKKRNTVQEGKQRRELGSELTEKTREEILSEKLRQIPRSFVLQTDSIPTMAFGASHAPRLPRYLEGMRPKRLSIDWGNDRGLMTVGSKSLPQREETFLSIPKEHDVLPPPTTPFTELSSTSTI